MSGHKLVIKDKLIYPINGDKGSGSSFTADLLSKHSAILETMLDPNIKVESYEIEIKAVVSEVEQAAPEKEKIPEINLSQDQLNSLFQDIFSQLISAKPVRQD